MYFINTQNLARFQTRKDKQIHEQYIQTYSLDSWLQSEKIVNGQLAKQILNAPRVIFSYFFHQSTDLDFFCHPMKSHQFYDYIEDVILNLRKTFTITTIL